MKAASLPSRAEILRYIEEHGGDATKRDLARAFGIKGEARRALRHILEDLTQDHTVVKQKTHIRAAGVLPDTFLADVSHQDSDGDLWLSPVDWQKSDGVQRPKVRLVVPPARRASQHSPRVGDRVLVKRLEGGRDGSMGARLIRTLPRPQQRALGVLQRLEDGTLVVQPTSKRNGHRALPVPEGFAHDAEVGDLVAVEVRHGRGSYRAPVAHVVERVTSLKSERAQALIAIHEHGLPDVFPDAALQEAEREKAAPLTGREDWRHLPFLTIDPVDAKDHDDAVYAEYDPAPENKGGFIVTVAIADVSHHVRSRSAMDAEALKRGNSVYFPDRVIPMLPERIANNLCSLREGEDRPVLAIRLVLNPSGFKLTHSLHRAMIRSCAKLSYQDAQAAFDGQLSTKTKPLYDQALAPLWAAYQCAAKARDKRAPLNLNLPERKLILSPLGTVDKVIVPPRLEAHRLIEEFMILANIAAAELLEAKRAPCMYRIHEPPSQEKLVALRDVLGQMGFSLPKSEHLRSVDFNRILARFEGEREEPMVQDMVLRTQSQAIYSIENKGHFGLNLKRYAHFTSPIRRYADLMVHRALIGAYKLGADGSKHELERQDLAKIASDISAAERRAMAAERDTLDRLIAGYLSDKIGETFDARVSGITGAGVFVRLNETGADGFLPMSSLGRQRFSVSRAGHALQGKKGGAHYRLGDALKVELVEAAPVAGALRFQLADAPPQFKKAPTQKSFSKRKRR